MGFNSGFKGLNFNVHGSVHRKNILKYVRQDATLHSLLYLETALHVSGGTTTKHVEQFPDKINCVTLHLVGYIFEFKKNGEFYLTESCSTPDALNSRLDSRTQSLDWRVFPTPTKLLYRIRAFGKRKHARWKCLQLLTRNYICLKTSASFLAHFLQAIWHFAQNWHIVLGFIRRERHFHDRVETRCL